VFARVERDEVRGAFRARWETLVGARSDGGALPPALKLRESTRLFGQFHPFGCSAAASWASSQSQIVI